MVSVFRKINTDSSLDAEQSVSSLSTHFMSHTDLSIPPENIGKPEVVK